MFTSAEQCNIDFTIAVGTVVDRLRVRFLLPGTEYSDSDQNLSETSLVDYIALRWFTEIWASRRGTITGPRTRSHFSEDARERSYGPAEISG